MTPAPRPADRGGVPGAAGAPEVPGHDLVRPLARGGMGQVWEAVDRATGVRRAVKTVAPGLLGDDAVEAVLRLRREAELLARLDHPGVVRVHAAGLDGARPWVALGLEPGGTVADLLARGPLPVARALRLAREVAQALAHAHARGVVHRDVKPSNVALGEDGRAVLLDFGVGRSLRPSTQRLTEAGAVLGTPGFLAPEQARGEDGDARADVYGAGALLFAMLTGRPPFEGDGLHATLEAVATRPARPPSALRPEVPPAVDAVVLAALAKRPEERPADAEALARALAAAAQARDGRRARRAAVAGLAAVVGLAAVGVAAGLSAAGQTRDPARPGGVSRDLGDAAGAPAPGPGGAVGADPWAGVDAHALAAAAARLDEGERRLRLAALEVDPAARSTPRGLAEHAALLAAGGADGAEEEARALLRGLEAAGAPQAVRGLVVDALYRAALARDDPRALELAHDAGPPTAPALRRAVVARWLAIGRARADALGFSELAAALSGSAASDPEAVLAAFRAFGRAAALAPSLRLEETDAALLLNAAISVALDANHASRARDRKFPIIERALACCPDDPSLALARACFEPPAEAIPRLRAALARRAPSPRDGPATRELQGELVHALRIRLGVRGPEALALLAVDVAHPGASARSRAEWALYLLDARVHQARDAAAATSALPELAAWIDAIAATGAGAGKNVGATLERARRRLEGARVALASPPPGGLPLPLPPGLSFGAVPGTYVLELGQSGQVLLPLVFLPPDLFAGVTEVSVEQFPPATGRPPDPRERALPRVGVSDEAVQDFLRGRGLALPTEAEWERLAAGAPPGDGVLATGDGAPTGPDGVHDARSRSSAGCRGVVGNVWEMTSTLEDGRVVLRGGSFRTPRGEGRVEARRLWTPDTSSDDVGFRVVVRRPSRPR